MLLSDTTSEEYKHVELKVINVDGLVCNIKADTSWNIDSVKLRAVAHFLPGCCDCRKESLYYKLVSVRHNKLLNEEISVTREHLIDGDEILLLKKRIDIPEFQDPQKKAEKLKSPTDDEIRAATRDVAPRNITGEDARTGEDEDDAAKAYSGEACRKIMVSLLDAAHRLHCMNPALRHIFTPAPEWREQAAEPRLLYSHVALRELVGMGFAERAAKIALHKNNNNVSTAVQWLLDNNSSTPDDIGVEVTEETCFESTPANETAGNTASPANQNEGAASATNDITSSNVQTEQNQDSTDSSNSQNENSKPKTDSMVYESELNDLPTSEKVKTMLNSFKQFARSQYQADPLAMQKLLDMGFDTNDALDALRITDNRQQLACEYLLKGEHLRARQTPMEGIDTTGELYLAIIESENVQLGLQNPLCVIAFLMMLESALAADRWLKNDDIGLMLVAIAKLYQQHCHKHSARV